MPCPQRLSAWQREVSSAFAHLSRTQANGLALWSAGIALTGSGGITQISVLLAQVLAQKEGTVFQRLREMGTAAIIMSGDPMEGKILHGQAAGPLPPGRGYFVQPRHPSILIQTAFSPPVYKDEEVPSM